MVIFYNSRISHLIVFSLRTLSSRTHRIHARTQAHARNNKKSRYVHIHTHKTPRCDAYNALCSPIGSTDVDFAVEVRNLPGLGGAGGGVSSRLGGGGGLCSLTNVTYVPGKSPVSFVRWFVPFNHFSGSGHSPDGPGDTTSVSPMFIDTSVESLASKGKDAVYSLYAMIYKVAPKKKRLVPGSLCNGGKQWEESAISVPPYLTNVPGVWSRVITLPHS